MTEKKTRSRKPRAQKAPVKVVADSPTLDEEKMLEEGFEKTRARTAKGHFVKDDPNTPEDEAWEWKKAEEEVVAEEAVPEPTPEPVVEEPVKVRAPVISYSGEAKVEEIGCRFKRKRAIRRQAR